MGNSRGTFLFFWWGSFETSHRWLLGDTEAARSFPGALFRCPLRGPSNVLTMAHTHHMSSDQSTVLAICCFEGHHPGTAVHPFCKKMPGQSRLLEFLLPHIIRYRCQDWQDGSYAGKRGGLASRKVRIDRERQRATDGHSCKPVHVHGKTV